MKWTLCFLVRDLATRQIVFHEIQEVEAPAAERAKMTNQRISELSMKYPPCVGLTRCRPCTAPFPSSHRKCSSLRRAAIACYSSRRPQGSILTDQYRAEVALYEVLLRAFPRMARTETLDSEALRTFR